MSVSQMSSKVSTKVSSAKEDFTFDTDTQALKNICESSTLDFYASHHINKLTKPCNAHELFEDLKKDTTHKSAESISGKNADTSAAPACEADQTTSLMQSDNSLSENGYSSILSTVSALGSVVHIYKQQSSDSHYIVFQSVGGQNFSFPFLSDIGIVENKDGSTSVHFSETNTTRVYDAFGNSRDFEGNTLGKKGDTIIVNIKSKSVRLGDGKNTIINFADGANIEAGDGNNFILSPVTEQNIRLGNGNNCVRIVQTQCTSSFSLGDGNNSILIHGLDASKVSVGHGNNTINTHEAKNSSEVILGNGNNVIELQEVYVSSSLVLGDGDNKVSLYRLRSESSVFIGNGNNMIKINEVADFSTVNMEDGNNTFSAQNISHNSTCNLGSGDNTLIMCDLFKALLHFGNGHNNVSLYNVKNSKIFLGAGNNLLDIFELETSSLRSGNGNNAVNIQEAKNSKIQLGDGKNSLHTMRFDGSSLYTGNGDNFMQVFIANKKASLEMGNGDNACIIDYLFDESKLSLGSGNNDIYVHEIQKNAHLNLGSGNNSVQMHTAVTIESISTGEGDNLGIIAHHAQSESVYLVGDIFYAQAQLETLSGEDKQDNISIANEINERRTLRKEKNLMIAAESAQDFNPHMTANTFIQQNQTWHSQKDNMEQRFLVQGKKSNGKSNNFFTDNKLHGVSQTSHLSGDDLYI